MLPDDLLERAAAAVRDADALLLTAGAGMGVDSGLPDFRGNEGFWRAYPPLARLGIRFVEMANPRWFARDPALAWGFYGHRLNLYRATAPHPGFALLRAWAGNKPGGGFVFTSNVDGQFQKAGFDEAHIVECHGSIHFLQCAGLCSDAIWPAEGVQVVVDEATLRAEPPLPSCPRCGGIARPNVLLFEDREWLHERTGAQKAALARWLEPFAHENWRLTVIECGAGGAVLTVRRFSEDLAAAGATLIRINPREPDGPAETIALAAGAHEALTRIDALLPRTASASV